MIVPHLGRSLQRFPCSRNAHPGKGLVRRAQLEQQECPGWGRREEFEEFCIREHHMIGGLTIGAKPRALLVAARLPVTARAIVSQGILGW